MNHPNRSKKTNAPGRNPTPAEIRDLREQMGLTQTDFGRLVYAGLSTVQAWEAGTRRMPPLPWEIIMLLRMTPGMARYRKRWQEILGRATARTSSDLTE